MIRMLKVLKFSAITLVLTSILSVCASAILLSTNAGMAFIGHIASRFVPGLSIIGAQGTAADLKVQSLQFSNADIAIDIRGLRVAIRVADLFRGRIGIDTIQTASTRIQIPTTTESQATPTASTEQRIFIPVPIHLRDLQMKNTVLSLDGMEIELGELAANLSASVHTINIESVQVDALNIHMLNVTERQSNDFEKTLQKLKHTLAHGPAKLLSDICIPLDVKIKQLRLSDVSTRSANQGNQRVIDTLTLRATTTESDINISDLRLQTPLWHAQAEARARVSGSWPIEAKVNIEQARNRATLDLSGALKKELTASLSVQTEQAGTFLAWAKIEAAHDNTPFSLTIKNDSPKLRHAPDTQAPAGVLKTWDMKGLELHALGNTQGFEITASGAIGIKNVPSPVTLSMHSTGSMQKINLEKLLLASGASRVTATGLISIDKQIGAQCTIGIHDLEPKLGIISDHLLAKKLTSQDRLNGQADLSFSLQPDHGDWTFELKNLQLLGTVAQNDIRVESSLLADSKHSLRLRQARVLWGKNRILADVDLHNQSLAGHVKLEAPKLAQLDTIVPTLSGRANGTVDIGGTLSNPAIRAGIRASHLTFEDLRVESAKLDIQVRDRTAPDNRAILDLKDVSSADLHYDHIELKALGALQRHRIGLVSHGTPASFSSTLEASVDSSLSQWHASVLAGQISTVAGSWTASSPVELNYNFATKSLGLSPHCWRNPKATVCIKEPARLGANGEIHVTIDALDLSLLNTLSPDQLTAHGSVALQAHTQWDAHGKPKLNASVNGANLRLLPIVADKTIQLDVPTIQASLNADSLAANMRTVINLGELGALNADLSVTDPYAERTLQGSAKLERLSLKLLSPFFANGENIDGHINGDLHFGGSAQSPNLNGLIDIRDVAIAGGLFPVQMTPSNLSLAFHGKSSTIQGVLRTADGDLSFNGDASWQDVDRWQAQISTTGKNLRITVPPMVDARVSPTVSLVASPALIRLTGNIDVPSAYLTVKEVPESAIGVSSHEVLLDKNMQPISKSSKAMQIESSVSVTLGDKVFVDAFGLRSRLRGSLKLTQADASLGLNGQVKLDHGSFRAYGQDLQIRRGDIDFVGPLSDSMLNFEAIRNPDATEDDVTVGIRVTGLASNPTTTVFSDPAMSDTAALSYLLRGQGLSGQSNDNAILTSMLVTAGVSQTGQFLGDLGNALRIRDLGMSTEGVGNNSQVVVSGYVLPGLQVKYGMGIFDSLSTLTLRYRLLPKLYLQAVNGIDQAVDLIYSFEF